MFGSFLFELFATGAIALPLVVLAILLERRGAWSRLLVGLLPFLLANILCYSSHVQMHSSIVYRIVVGGAPPDNPLLGGEPLRYAWIHHYLVAKLCGLIGITPPWGFTLLNLVALGLTFLLLYKITAMLSDDRLVRFYGVILGLIGMSPLLRGPGHRVFLAATGFDLNPRVYPVVKFITVNSNGLGLACFALLIFALMTILFRERQRQWGYLLLLLSVLSTAHLYPLLLPAVYGVAGVVTVGCALQIAGKRRDTLLAIPLVLVVSGLLSLPYLSTLRSGRVDAGEFLRLDLSLRHVGANGVSAMMAVAFAAALLLLYRREVANAFRHRIGPVTVLACAAALPILMFLGVHQPDHTEYKYLAAGLLPLGSLTAVGFGELRRRRPWAAAALLFLFVLPLASYYLSKGLRGWNLADPFRSRGLWMEHQDRAQEGLHSWIRAETGAESLFIDTHLSIPAFTGRALVVGTDLRRQRGELEGRRDGWYVTADRLLRRNFASDPGLVDGRLELARRLLVTPAGTAADARDLEGLLPRDRTTYVVVREPTAEEALAAQDWLRRDYAAAGIAVYRWMR